jgi:hypothetical protein
MRRLLVCVLLMLAGCRLPPDRSDLKLLDEKLPVPEYADLYLRARSQATLALEAFYTDSWKELDDAAKAIEQTARLLPKSKEIPTSRVASVGPDSGKLEADAKTLGDAARAKNVDAANAAMQRIQYAVRALRPRITQGPDEEE